MNGVGTKKQNPPFRLRLCRYISLGMHLHRLNTTDGSLASCALLSLCCAVPCSRCGVSLDVSQQLFILMTTTHEAFGDFRTGASVYVILYGIAAAQAYYHGMSRCSPKDTPFLSSTCQSSPSVVGRVTEEQTTAVLHSALVSNAGQASTSIITSDILHKG